MPHGQFSVQELLPGHSPSLPCSDQEAGNGAEQPSPTHRVQEPKAVLTDTQQHPATSSPLMWKLLPLHSFLSQHPVACQECDATQNGQVLQSLEHVELSPVDIHESQHRWGKKKRQPMAETAFQRPTFVILRTTVLPGLSIWFLSEALKLWMAALKTTHYCQGMKTSGFPFWSENVTLTACNQLSCGRIMDIL